MPDVRVLSFHAGYRCRNAGACCTSNWPIPIEADRHARIRGAIAGGALRTVADDSPAFAAPADDDPALPAVLATSHGRCVFHDPAGRCAIHSALGHDALPLACRQFPRVSVIDPRGVSVTLSHYCPTAAALLNDGNDGNDRELEGRDGSVAIVVNTQAFPSSGEYVGLDARTALPPLLRPGMLMDWESWWEIERLSVQTLLTGGGSPEEAVGLVRGATQSFLLWRPERGPLFAAVQQAFREVDPVRGPDTSTLVRLALDAIPEEARESAELSAVESSSQVGDRALRRFLAAHAFANWTIHLGQGVMPWVRSIETALAFIEAGVDVRRTDLVLRHLIDPKAFAGEPKT